LANNDEKYLDGPGLTSILQKSKAITDDHEGRIDILELAQKDKDTLTGAEIKALINSGLKDVFKIGDVINTGNGKAICINKNVTLDADGDNVYNYSNYSMYTNNIKAKGFTYDYLFMFAPNIKIALYATDTKREPDSKSQDDSNLISMFSSMDSNLKDVIENTVMYYEFIDRKTLNNSKIHKSKYYIHFPDFKNITYTKQSIVEDVLLNNIAQQYWKFLSDNGFAPGTYSYCGKDVYTNPEEEYELHATNKGISSNAGLKSFTTSGQVRAYELAYVLSIFFIGKQAS